MKRNLLTTTFAGAIAGLAGAFLGCDSALLSTNVADVAPEPEPVTEEFSAFLDGPPTMAADGCSREIQLISGEWICVDDVIATLQSDNLPDEDNDGIPNLNDDDIDGDGIPNSHDVDIDGDGLFNGIDDDVDADGVPNERDADVDGDFIRNRWDLDIDGDLVYNAYDRDADGDGLDDEEADEESDEFEPNDQDDENDNDNSADDDNDNGTDPAIDPDESGMNAPVTEPPTPSGPTTAERDAIDAQHGDALNDDEDAVISLRNLFAEVDQELEPEDYFDGFHRLLMDAMEDNQPVATEETLAVVSPVPIAVRVEVPQRALAVFELSAVEPNLPELVGNVDALADAARELAANLADLVNTAVAYGVRDVTPDATEATAIGIELHEIADENRIEHSDVAEIVPPAVVTADALNGPSDDNNPIPVFRIVASLSREFQNDDGNAAFAPVRVAQMIERLAGLAESPTEELLIDSAVNILNAAIGGDTQLDPLAIVDALDDAGADPTDGVSEEEATNAAAIAASNEAND